MKHVLVTGASSGIGFECCRYLLQLDMSVLGIARRPISMRIADRHPEHFYSISADLTHKSSYDRISSFYSEHAIDVIDYIIICAAKIDPITSLLSAQGDDLVSNFSLNVLSPLYLLRPYFHTLHTASATIIITLVESFVVSFVLFLFNIFYYPI